MNTIAEMAPASSLANQTGGEADGATSSVQVKTEGGAPPQAVPVINPNVK